jgi:Domain of unknown function (DUF4912)
VDGEANENTLHWGDAVGGADEGSLPPAYESDTLELMVRDPTSGHAYWDLSIDRIDAAVGPRDRRRAFLRLFGVPSGYLLAEYAVPAERGSQAVVLPQADSSYLVELAVMQNYQWVVLARSNVVHAPPTTARVATTPAFVSREQQLRLLAESRDRDLGRPGGDLVAAAPTQARHVEQAADAPVSVGPPERVSSKTRPLPAGSELRAASELYFTRAGSEARLTRREPLRIAFVMPGSAAITAPAAAALDALAAAVWLGRDPIDVLHAGNKLASTLADAGMSSGPVLAILDPPGPNVAPPEPTGSHTASTGSEAHTVSESPDGSITVTDRGGNFVAYSPVPSAGVGVSGGRSAAAIVGVRHEL